MTRRKKIGLWIIAAIFVPILVYLALLISFFIRFPIRDPERLKALNAEARVLIAKKFVPTKKWTEGANNVFDNGNIDLRKSDWPPAIASLSPEIVTVEPGRSVEIITVVYFDGGWGYDIVPGGGEPPMPIECYEKLGWGIYWHGPC